MLKRHLALAALAVAALIPLACDSPNESGRAIMDVSNINDGTPVALSVTSGTADNVDMEFRWRPYNNTLIDQAETSPHGDVIVVHYRITWTSISGSAAIPAREENTSIFVPVYKLVTAGIRVATAEEKAGVTAPSTMLCHIDFNAREMGTTSKVDFSTEFTVSFTN